MKAPLITAAFIGASDAQTLAATVTESRPAHTHIQREPSENIIQHILEDNQRAARAVERALPQITALTEEIIAKMRSGGRLFYIGAGSSGRYGIVDAAECPPTFGTDDVIGIIAGGDNAMRTAIEGTEDNKALAWQELSAFSPQKNDVVVGLAASGRTPYVIGGLETAKQYGLTTGCIVCNEDSAIENISDFPIVAVVGPAPVTGSTRMGAGTAQKVILNCISTTVLSKLGYVYDNIMINMKLSNEKLITRAARNIHHILNAHNDGDPLVEEDKVRAVILDVLSTMRAAREDARVLDVINAFAQNGHSKARAIITECAALGNKHAESKLKTLIPANSSTSPAKHSSSELN